MSKKKTKSTLVLDKITPRLGVALQELVHAKKQAILNAGNYYAFQASFEVFIQAADEVCREIERMRVNG